MGAFVALHLWGNAYAWRGAAAYDRHLEALRQVPYYHAFLVLFVLLPLLFHAAYGVIITFFARLNLRAYPFPRHTAFWLQRASGLLALAFIVYHVVTVRASVLFTGETATYERVAASLAHPGVLAFYALGVLAVGYHLANGLWLFAVLWGLAVGPRAQRTAARAAAVVFVLVAVVGLNDLRAFLAGAPHGGGPFEARRPAASAVPAGFGASEAVAPGGFAKDGSGAAATDGPAPPGEADR